jgi:hypothetical protein
VEVTESFRTAWWQRLLAEPATYEITRFAVVRLLGFVYLVAFGSLALQVLPLFGRDGLLPAAQFLANVHERLGGNGYWRVPSLFWFGSSDAILQAASLAGVLLSAAVVAGVTNGAVQLVLWLLYASFVHVGQIFYGYGWEFQLLETGMLAVFLCPMRSLRPFPRTATPTVVLWLLRWLSFRVMLGSGLIKLRGDSCWTDLTCLDFHFETQPNPNPLSWWMHHSPHALHAGGVLLTHFVEVVAPWFVFAFRPWRLAAGTAIVGFQFILILTGNLSFLNWLTIVPALACFDDAAFARLLPASRRAAIAARFEALLRSRAQRLASSVYAVLVALLSVFPVINLASCRQEMNTSYEPLALVNTYGAFGGIDRERFEVILEGTRDEIPGRDARWIEYELPCMPGDPRRRPCVVTPYQHRLDWQMWFVGNASARGEALEQDPWLVHLVWKLLRGDPTAKRLLARDPFPGEPPRWIRARIWRYRFTVAGEKGWWARQPDAFFLRPVSLEHPGLREYVRAYEWPDAPTDG